MSKQRDSARAARLRERKQKKRDLRKREREQRREKVMSGKLPKARVPLVLERTPKEITPAISDFCKRLVPESEPAYLDVTALPWCVTSACYVNVEKQIQDQGGDVQHGWLIWEWAGWFLAGEFHTVWVTDGQLVDITPTHSGDRQVLFLPDPHRVWKRRVVPTVREALRDHPLLNQFLELMDEIDLVRMTAQHTPTGLPLIPAKYLLPRVRQCEVLTGLLWRASLEESARTDSTRRVSA